MAAREPDDEHEEFRAPLPKDDRLWRHPSELEDAPKRAVWRPYRRHRATDPVVRSN